MNTLRSIGLIAARELRSYFLQPLAWVVITVLLLLNGWNFWFVVATFNQMGAPSAELVRFFFSGLLFWLPLWVSLAVIAMRLIAEERQTGTLETLLTAPVTENQVAIGKYLAAIVFFCVLWSPFLLYLGLLEWYGEVDWRAAAAGMLGLLLVGGYLLAAAMCASALTRNQIVAAIAGFVVVMALFIIPFLAGLLVRDDIWRDVWKHLDLLAALDEFARGVMRSSRLVYPLSGIVFFVFATARLIEFVKGK